MKWWFRIAAALCAVVGGASAAQAQYFGQNKVQYEKFEFKVLKTEHFDIYYYPEEAASVQLAARMAERWYARLSKVLKHELNGRQPLILYAAHPHFQQTNVLAGEIGEGTGGVTESSKRRIILPFAGGLAETDHVLGHELVHAFQYDIAMPPGSDPRASAMGALPLWFVEGHGRISLARPGRLRSPRCGCATRRHARRCRRSTSWTIPSSFPIATATPSGPTSGRAGATRRSAICSTAPRASAASTMRCSRR